MKNYVSVELFAPYEYVEFDGLRKALKFAIESDREAYVHCNGKFVWQTYNGSKKIEAAMYDALEVMHRHATKDNSVVHFQNSNIVKLGNVYAKKIGEACYDDNGLYFDVCCIYEDLAGNKIGYDPYFDMIIEVERVNLRTLFNDKNRKKRGRRSNSHNKQQKRNKKLDYEFKQFEENDLPF